MTSNGEARGDHDLVLVRRLPDDVLAKVLRRLAPRWLAASRCVCKAWHAVVDARRLLRADLLPLSLDGIIIYFRMHFYWEFFSRPAPHKGRSIEYLLTVDAWDKLIDHCNGLLLLGGGSLMATTCKYVANPATGWAAPLPPCPSPCLATEGDYYSYYLVFDPSVSMHYEVFSIPRLSPRRDWLKPQVLEKSEWPPSTFIMRVFSSVSQTWEDRSFSRQGEPSEPTDVSRYLEEPGGGVYWRGSLYIRCETDTVMRLSSSQSKFREIQPPIIEERFPELHLGRSEKGVYFASLWKMRLRVWILDESCGHMKWVLRHDNNLGPILPGRDYNRRAHGSWILQDINNRSGLLDHPPLYVNEESLSRDKFTWNSTSPDEEFEWNSDDDNAHEEKDMAKVSYREDIHILGLHPFKEIVFFSQSIETGLAYYLNTSRVQVLGDLYPTNYDDFVTLHYEKEIMISLPYTPCLIEMCPRQN